MSSTTVAEFAKELKKPTDTLIEQLKAAGVNTSSESDSLTEKDKQKLLTHLQISHGTATTERKKISLVKKSTSEIKQADATGKARTIQVEVRKKRTFVKRDENESENVDTPEPQAAVAAVQPVIDLAELARREEDARRQAELIRRQEEELAEKRRAREAKEASAQSEAKVVKAKKSAASRAKSAEDEASDAQALADEEVISKAKLAAKISAEEDTLKAKDLDTRRRNALAEAEAIRDMMSSPQKVAPKKVVPPPVEVKPIKGTLHKPAGSPSAKERTATGAPAAPGNKEIKSAKLSSSWADEQAKKKEIKTRGDSSGGVGRNSWRGGPRGRRERTGREDTHESSAPVEARTIEVHVPETITVAELAHKMAVKASEVIKQLMKLGQMATINQPLDQDTAMILVEEMGHKAIIAALDDPEAFTEEESSAHHADSITRAPVVTVMGHVDHGKTSLLDFIRRAKVASGEAGGITQHIGAYHVETPRGMISFLDTPGHEAFTAMRARGAQVTDVAIIIVAADDDVMPQTKEAISHAQAANVPMIFAINKIDKPGANPDKIREQLSAMNILVEDWGGKYQVQEISARQNLNIDALLDKVLLEAELLDLHANPAKNAVGTVIESSLDKGKGYVTNMLVESGTMRIGDIILVGRYYGRVRAMQDEHGQALSEAGPAQPVSVLGINGAPSAGDKFNVLDDEKEAKSIAQKREQLYREQGLRTTKHITLDEIGRRLAIGDFKELNIIVKGDVDGSIEALSDSLLNLSTEEIQVNIVHKGVGAITEADVNLASASDAIIVGFQVRPTLPARKLAESEQIDIRMYSIIYKAIEEIKAAMEGMLSPDIEEKVLGSAEVRETFDITKVGTIAGCYVLDGIIKRSSKIRLIRDGIVIHSGSLGSLKRFKDDVKEVKNNYECGLNIDKFNDIKIGDIIEAYEEVEVARKL